jgi:hypothetical protein
MKSRRPSLEEPKERADGETVASLAAAMATSG